MPSDTFLLYLLVTAGVTYLIRALPLLLVKKKIENPFVLSFLHYVPYAVLSVMTVPAIFYSTGDFFSALAGCAVALLLAYFEKSLLTVAAAACTVALALQLIL